VSNKVNQESAWDRSAFAMTSDEIDVHEALNALARLLGKHSLPPATLEVVRHAYERLRMERDWAI